jgi:hypothetical protein
VAVAGAFSIRAQSTTPAIFFTDIVSGPVTGGESVSGYAGPYVTIYGNFFGTSQGSSTVTLNGSNCGRVVSWGTTWNWYQKIVYQLGPTCTSGAFSVNVNGVSSICENNDDGNGCNYTVRSGNIRCVSTTGNNSNSGTFSGGCWQTPLYTVLHLAAGDIAYVENGVVQSGDDGTNCSTQFDWGYCNSVANGTSASPIALLAYPGATATIGDLSASDPARAIKYGGTYWRIGEMTLRGYGYALLDAGAYFWMVGNDIRCVDTGSQQSGCVTVSESTYSWFFGNYFHDMAPTNSNKEGHTFYLTSDANHSWVGWNRSYNNNSCYNFQVHSSLLNAGTGLDQYDLHLHDNQINGDTCTGFNILTVDPSKGAIEIYNNVVWYTGVATQTGYPELNGYNLGCIVASGGTENGANGSGTIQVYNNTCYNSGDPGNTYAEIPDYKAAFDWVADSTVYYNLTNNVTYQPNPGGSGNGWLSPQTYFGPDTAQMTCTNGHNAFYGVGTAPSNCNTSAVSADPQFTAVANDLTANFVPQSTSPLIGAGSTAKYSPYDINGLVRPSPPSIGAYEYSQGTAVARPGAPTNLSVTVQP